MSFASKQQSANRVAAVNSVMAEIGTIVHAACRLASFAGNLGDHAKEAAEIHECQTGERQRLATEEAHSTEGGQMPPRASN
jgi:hypothetical protein